MAVCLVLAGLIGWQIAADHRMHLGQVREALTLEARHQARRLHLLLTATESLLIDGLALPALQPVAPSPSAGGSTDTRAQSPAMAWVTNATTGSSSRALLGRLPELTALRLWSGPGEDRRLLAEVDRLGSVVAPREYPPDPAFARPFHQPDPDPSPTLIEALDEDGFLRLIRRLPPDLTPNPTPTPTPGPGPGSSWESGGGRGAATRLPHSAPYPAYRLDPGMGAGAGAGAGPAAGPPGPAGSRPPVPSLMTATLNLRAFLASGLPAGSCGIIVLDTSPIARMGPCSADRLTALIDTAREAHPRALRQTPTTLVGARRVSATSTLAIALDMPLGEALAVWRQDTLHIGGVALAGMILVGLTGASMLVQARRAEAAETVLRQREAQLSAALKGSGLGFWEFIPDSGALILNEGALRSTTPEPMWPRVAPQDRMALHDALHAHVTPQTPAFDTVCRMDLGNGSLTWVRLRGRAMPDDGDPDGRLRITGLWADVTEQTAASEERRRLAAAMEHAPVAVLIGDAEGRIHYANSRVEPLLGAPPAAWIGRPLDRIFPLPPPSGDSDPAEARDDTSTRAMAQAVQTGTAWSGEIAWTAGDRTRRWVQVSVAPIHEPDGSLSDMIAIVEDITPRRWLEDRLAAQIATLTAVLEAAPSGILVADRLGRPLLSNHRLTRIWAVPRAHLDSADPWVLFQAMSGSVTDPRDFMDSVRRLTADPRATEQGNEIHLRDGRVIMRRSLPVVDPGIPPVFDPIPDSDLDLEPAVGAEARRVWFFTETTEQKRVEQALSDQLEFQHTLVNTLPNPLFYTDREGRFLGCNRAFAEFLGISPEAVFGVTARDLLPRDQAEALAGDNAPLLGQGGLRFYELTLADAKGHPKTLSVAKAAFSDAQGRINGLVGILTDISDLKRAAEDLRRSNQELEQFAYVASHDLQEPLRMVTSYLGLLKRRYGGRLGEDADEFMGYAIDGAKRMQALIQDLLQFSRIDTRGNPLAPVDVGACLVVAVDNLRVAIEEAGARLEVGPLPWVEADAAQIISLFQNLIGNAVKYRSPSRAPVVRLAARRDGDLWVFSVADNGIGIDPRFAEKVFLIFQRLQTRDHYEGTGIGLALCKKIVERHGGQIWLEGVEGVGTTFYFTLRALTDTPNTDTGEGEGEGEGESRAANQTSPDQPPPAPSS